MLISTRRFGNLDLNGDDLFLFPSGIIGMEKLKQWALIPDAQNEAMAYLQSTSQGDVSLPVISPRAFFDDYRVRVGQRALAVLKLRAGSETFIVTAVSENSGRMTTNLRAPIILNLEARLGAQLITTDEQSVQQPLPSARVQKEAA